MQVDAVVMFTTIELVNPLTSASQRHASGVTFPAPHGKHPTKDSSTFILFENKLIIKQKENTNVFKN